MSNIDGLFILRATLNPLILESTDLELNAFGVTETPASSSLLLSGSFKNCDVVIHDLSDNEVLRVNSIPAVNGLNLDVSLLNKGVFNISLFDTVSGVEIAVNKFVILE